MARFCRCSGRLFRCTSFFKLIISLLLLLFPPSCGRLYVLRTRSSDSFSECSSSILFRRGVAAIPPDVYESVPPFFGAISSTIFRRPRLPSPFRVKPPWFRGLRANVGPHFAQVSARIHSSPHGRAFRRRSWSFEVEEAASQRSWTSSTPCFTRQSGFFEPYLSYGFSAKSRLVQTLLSVLFPVVWAALFPLSRRIFRDCYDDRHVVLFFLPLPL